MKTDQRTATPDVAEDKERLAGLLGAPFAAAIALLVYGALVAHDPPAISLSRLAGSKHVPASLYAELLGVLLLLAIAMLATAWLRKRLLLGSAMAMYGLAILNLHYWGFALPYLLFGGWMLLRTYRARRDLRAATPGSSSTSGAGARTTLAGTPAPRRRSAQLPTSSTRRRVREERRR